MKLRSLLHYVTDLEKSVEFYKEALGSKEVNRQNIEFHGEEYEIVSLSDGEMETLVQLVSKTEGEIPERDLGENEVHHCYVAKNYEETFQKHKDMEVVIYENVDMGLYFIVDPDNHWIEVVPDRKDRFTDGPEYALVHYNRNIQTLERADQFYTQFLGLEPSSERESGDKSFILKFVKDKVTGFEVELTYLVDHKDTPYNVGDSLDTLIFETDQDLSDLAQTARSRDYQVEELILHYNNQDILFLSVLDPDGYRNFIFHTN